MRRRADQLTPHVTAWAAVLALACNGEVEDRPQLLVVVDTNAPVPGQLAGDATLSPQAAVDSLRVEVFEGGERVDALDFVLPDESAWPASFGVAPGGSSPGAIDVRVQAFRAELAETDVVDGATVARPLPDVSIDRLIHLDLPSRGVHTVTVVLDAECRGRPVDFLTNETCVSGDMVRGASTEGIEFGGDVPTTRAGTWEGARAVDCTAAAEADRLCIPGGFSVLGDTIARGFNPDLILDAVPLRPVSVTPFWMDRTEFTVGRLRELLRDGKAGAEGIRARIGGDPFQNSCTFLGEDREDQDAFPLNCVEWSKARELCRAVGGDLPSEAEWEHAARGRGQGRRFPWGDADAACCRTSVARADQLDTSTDCDGFGPEPAGSHVDPAECDGTGDVSRDGVVDLGGSVSEWTRDSFVPYASPCWANAGIARDPTCSDERTELHTVRGGSWAEGLSITVASLRRTGPDWSANKGFRCVYPD